MRLLTAAIALMVSVPAFGLSFTSQSKCSEGKKQWTQPVQKCIINRNKMVCFYTEDVDYVSKYDAMVSGGDIFAEDKHGFSQAIIDLDEKTITKTIDDIKCNGVILSVNK